jgi:hypothetical protein
MSKWQPMKIYERYTGFQTYPLSSEEQNYDDTCREIDKLERTIGSLSMNLFTAREFIWFNNFVNKMHIFPKQPQLDRQLSDLHNLLTSLEGRKGKTE